MVNFSSKNQPLLSIQFIYQSRIIEKMQTQNRARQILIHGLALVLVGIIWGLVMPHTPFPRLALSAHIQAVLNGMLFTLMAVLLLTLPHKVSARSALVML